jgi:hypothetical protein
MDNQEIKDKLRKDRAYATDMYRALCNLQWFKEDQMAEAPEDRKVWTCTWRYAGGMIADLRCEGEDYLDFYCSGKEGMVTSEVRQDLADLGWHYQEWPMKQELDD